MTQLPPFLIEVFRLSLWLMLLVVIFVPLERLFAAHPQKFVRKGIGVDLGYYFLSGLVPALLMAPGRAAGLDRAARGARRRAGGVRRVAPLGEGARRAGGGRGRLLLGTSVESRDPLSLAVPLDPPQRRGTRLPGEHPRSSGRHGVRPILRPGSDVSVGIGRPDGCGRSAAPLVATLIGTIWGYFIHANVRWQSGRWSG